MHFVFRWRFLFLPPLQRTPLAGYGPKLPRGHGVVVGLPAATLCLHWHLFNWFADLFCAGYEIFNSQLFTMVQCATRSNSPQKLSRGEFDTCRLFAFSATLLQDFSTFSWHFLSGFVGECLPIWKHNRWVRNEKKIKIIRQEKQGKEPSIQNGQTDHLFLFILPHAQMHFLILHIFTYFCILYFAVFFCSFYSSSFWCFFFLFFHFWHFGHKLQPVPPFQSPHLDI